MTETALSLNDDDELRTLRFYCNLLGAGKSVSMLVGQLDPKTLLLADGHEVLLRYVEQKRFSPSDFREISPAYDVFFEKTHFRRHGGDSMSAFSGRSLSRSATPRLRIAAVRSPTTSSATWR